MSDATTVDMSLQQSCDAAMLHANVEVRLLIDKANRLERHNTNLREERDMYRDLVGLMHHPDVDAQLQAENAKLRELVRGLQYCAHEAYGMCARTPVGGKQPFTCCPLYDFDAKEYQCEKLMLELGVEVDG